MGKSINDDIISLCANCGKGEESAGDLKACTACKIVKYCNRDCQIAHRPQHKKACKRRAAELHDEKLFIVIFVCYYYPHFLRGQSINLAVGKGFAVDAFMRSKNEMVVSVFVHFAELQSQCLLQTKRLVRGLRNVRRSMMPKQFTI